MLFCLLVRLEKYTRICVKKFHNPPHELLDRLINAKPGIRYRGNLLEQGEPAFDLDLGGTPSGQYVSQHEQINWPKQKTAQLNAGGRRDRVGDSHKQQGTSQRGYNSRSRAKKSCRQ